jgi:hypothetical protein
MEMQFLKNMTKAAITAFRPRESCGFSPWMSFRNDLASERGFSPPSSALPHLRDRVLIDLIVCCESASGNAEEATINRNAIFEKVLALRDMGCEYKMGPAENPSRELVLE